MTSRAWARAATALLAVSATAATTVAQAAAVDFDSVTPGTLLFAGMSTTVQGVNFDVQGDFAVVDTVAAFGPGGLLDLAPPTGNSSAFLTVLNDSWVTLSAADGSALRLLGLDFAYVAPLRNLFVPGEAAGMLLAEYMALDGSTVGLESWDFGMADGNGEFGFLSIGFGSMGALAAGVKSVTFAACAYDGAGNCVLDSGGLSMFALDNLQVPEPASWGLAALALLGVGAGTGLRRRRA